MPREEERPTYNDPFLGRLIEAIGCRRFRKDRAEQAGFNLSVN